MNQRGVAVVLKANGANHAWGSSPPSSANRRELLRARYYLKPFIEKMIKNGSTLREVSDFFECHEDTIRLARLSLEPGDELTTLGEEDHEFLRVAAVNACRMFFSLRGWQIGESDAKCAFDLFCLRDTSTIRIQVRSSRAFDGIWPIFKTSRLHFNTKECKRVSFPPDSFDYWFFFSVNKDAWLIPPDKITSTHTATMSGYDAYYCGNF